MMLEIILNSQWVGKNLFAAIIPSWNGFYHGSWHLHGHVHGRGSNFSFRVMDVGVDANNYFPVSWEQVQKRLTGVNLMRRLCGKAVISAGTGLIAFKPVLICRAYYQLRKQPLA